MLRLICNRLATVAAVTLSAAGAVLDFIGGWDVEKVRVLE